jgi:DNA-binding MarR family transcriptional regulator
VVTDISWLNDREQRVWRSFLAVHARLTASLNRQIQREAGLSGADYQVLVSLSESPAGRLRAYEIGEATGWEKSRLSHHLSRMAQRGLVERQACTTDVRYADVVLTEAGRSAIVNAAPRHVAHVREWFFDALTPEQLDQLERTYADLLARLDHPSPCATDFPCDEENPDDQPPDLP